MNIDVHFNLRMYILIILYVWYFIFDHRNDMSIKLKCSTIYVFLKAAPSQHQEYFNCFETNEKRFMVTFVHYFPLNWNIDTIEDWSSTQAQWEQKQEKSKERQLGPHTWYYYVHTHF